MRLPPKPHRVEVLGALRVFIAHRLAVVDVANISRYGHDSGVGVVGGGPGMDRLRPESLSPRPLGHMRASLYDPSRCRLR